MQKSTMNKILEINKLIEAGASEKDIIRLKFKNSKKLYLEWVEKYGKFISNNVNDINMFDLDINKLRLLIENTDKILKLLDVENRALLNVPDELLKLDDIKISTVRLSSRVEERFNELALKNKMYTKTTLLNLAILEFIEKYSR